MPDTQELKKVLRAVRNPAQYIGQEENSIYKADVWLDEPGRNVRVCLCYPDKYEVGMSNLGLNILYFRGNALPEAAVERAFLPEDDMLAALQKKSWPLFALESRRPVKDFDAVGFTLQHELTYTNVLLFLDRAQIPLLAKERGENDPLIFAGGPCAFNPEPLADFLDVVLVGEGEELFEDFLRVLAEPDFKKLPRSAKLEYLAALSRDGIYIPALRNKTAKNYIKDLRRLNNPVKTIIPYIDTVHNRLVLEIMRGCLHGCRFCQAGFTWRPLRPRPLEDILRDAENGLLESGYAEISLLSLTATDYPQIEELVCALNQKYVERKINVSLPSLRTESISAKLLAETQKVRRSTVTIAPEAGTQRLRDIIHKEMTEENILQAARIAIDSGIRSLKLYFILGLPGETDADVLAIPALAEKILDANRQTRNFTLTISASNFVPKAHTPFQWAAVNPPEEIKRKQSLIKQNLHSRRVQFRYHQAESSAIEAVLSRSGREIGAVILAAYRLGCRYDAWQEHFKYSLWLQALAQCAYKLEDFLQAMDVDKELPWDNIHTLVPKSYLRKEYERAVIGENRLAE
ncbi:MAG: radical SAM protein [Candidatus Margulisbacteria bacterium]|nr:radical SAM protein [Candidatus Margulisiibacteriota bacterium]